MTAHTKTTLIIEIPFDNGFDNYADLQWYLSKGLLDSLTQMGANKDTGDDPTQHSNCIEVLAMLLRNMMPDIDQIATINKSYSLKKAS